MRKIAFLSIVSISILGGCASKPPESEKSATLGEFIDRVSGETVPNIAAATLAKAVKKVPNNRDIFVQQNNIKKVEAAFDKWCLTVSMDYDSVYKFPFKTLQKDMMSATTNYQNSMVPMNACFAKNTKSLIAGYVVLSDGMIAFYGPDEANDIRSGNLIIENSEKHNAAILAEKRKAEAIRQMACKVSLDENIRQNIAIGTQTNYGMVVDIKKPLVQVQKYRDGAPVLEWVKVVLIAAPEMSNYCR
jgi:hypothetical protein